MPGFAEDPQLLTKAKLKRELVAHKVALPAGEHKKEVYVRLYHRHVAPTGGADFSSDEDDSAAPSLHGADGGVMSSDGVGTTSDMTSKVKVGGLDVDVPSLSNAELARKIKEFGVSPGPIVATTRKLYEKKLLRLLEHGDAAPSTAAAGNSGVNGSLQADRYSDTEEDEDDEEEEEEAEEEEMADVYEQTGEETEKAIQTSFLSPFKTHSTKDLKLGGGNDADLFILPSGISATRRRPIRGCSQDGWGGFSPDLASRSSLGLGASPISCPRGQGPIAGPVHKAAASGPVAASVPVWARLVAFVVACVFIVLVYYAFEENVQLSGPFDGAADATTVAAADGGKDGGGVMMAE